MTITGKIQTRPFVRHLGFSVKFRGISVIVSGETGKRQGNCNKETGESGKGLRKRGMLMKEAG